MFRVPVAPLQTGLHAEVVRPTSDELDLDPEIFSNIEVDLRLDIGHRRILAAFDVSAIARVTCDRTLDLFDLPVAGSHTVLFLSPEIAPEESDDDTLQVLPSDATEIDLTDAVRDTLLLAVPLRRVSPDAESLPITTTFGAPDGDDSPVDHWAALRSLGSESGPSDTTD